MNPPDPRSAAAIDHILLGYDYVARGDMDGCGSLVEADVTGRLVGDRMHRGRAELVAQLATAAVLLPDLLVVVCRSVVVARGRTEPGGDEVVDTLVVGPHGLIRSWHRSWLAE